MSIRKLFSSQLLLSLRNVGWMFVDKIFRMGTSLLVGIWLARYLGPDQYGLLNYAYVFPLILSAIVSLGMNTLLGSEIPVSSSPEQIDRLLFTSTALKLLSGFLAFGVILGINFYVHQNSFLLLRLVSISAATLLLQGFDTVDIYFQSVRKVQYSIIPKIISFAIATLARIYGLIHELGLSYFVAITIAELATGYISIFWIYIWQRKISFSQQLFDSSTAYRLLKLAWPIMLAEFFIFIYMKVDQLMIKMLSTSQELGNYSAALRLSETWYFVATALTASFYPKFADLYNKDKNRFIASYQKLLNIMLYTSVILSVLVTIFSKVLVSATFGAAYSDVAFILSIHIWSGIFVFTGIGVTNLLILNNLQKFLLIKTVIGALINIALNFWLIPSYGAVGASIATLVAYSVSAYLSNYFHSRARMVFIMQTNSFLSIFAFKVSTIQSKIRAYNEIN